MPAVVNLAIFSSLACLAVVSLPALIFIWGILWGISLVLSGCYLNRIQLLTIFVANIGLIYLFSGGEGLIYPLAIYGIPGLVMAVLLSHGHTFYKVLRWGMLSIVLSVSLFLGLAYLQLGEGGINALQNEMQNSVQESIKMSEDSGLLDFYADHGISPEEIQSSIKNAARTMFRYLPAFFYLQGILAVYLILYLSSFWAKRRNLPALQKRPFSEEIMPWQLSWLVIAGLACWLLGRDSMQLLYYTGANILAVSVPVTVYFGCSHLAYRLQHMQGRGKNWLIALVIILSLFFTVSAIIFIGLVGLFDSLLDYRKLRHQRRDIK